MCVTDPSMDAVDVLLAVRGYVKHFFGCEECRKNFLRGARHIDDAVVSDRDAVLFLWRSHNKANDRLHRDVTEDPQHPKVQFPDRVQCPGCHGTSKNGSAAWNEDKVFEFLLRMYSSPITMVKDSEAVGMRPVQYRWENSEKHVVAPQLGVSSASVVSSFVPSLINATKLDVSLCVAFYALCSGLLGLMYYRFCRRFRVRKPSSSYWLV